MNEKMELFHGLHRIKRENYQLREGENSTDFLPLIIKYIGDVEPELRDDLICSTLYQWMSDEEMVTNDQLHDLLTILTDDKHLFYGIGQQGDVSVFTRAFSVLPLALILERHRKKAFLSNSEFELIKESLIRYFQTEKDFRGYVIEQGWAHSAAHGADALVELVQCPEANNILILQVLNAIKVVLHNGVHIFSEEEDERIARIVDIIIEKERLSQQEIAEWIISLAECSHWQKNRKQEVARINSKNFLRSLYFRRLSSCKENFFYEIFFETESKLNPFKENVSSI